MFVNVLRRSIGLSRLGTITPLYRAVSSTAESNPLQDIEGKGEDKEEEPWKPKLLSDSVHENRSVESWKPKFLSDPKHENKSEEPLKSNLFSDAIGPSQYERKSVLEKCEEDVSHVAPYLQPTFNFAAYVNKSETLQQLVNMGVNLHTIEKIRDAPQFILGLDFDGDIKPHVAFFHHLGLPVEAIANIFTKNPFILKEEIENLQVRINYLKSKRFNKDMILRILDINPYLLSHSTQIIDNKLGFLKKSFGLTAQELREVVTKKPKMITYNEKHIKKNIFVITEEMGFTPDELKKLVLKCPVIFMKNYEFLLKTFEFVHKQMNIPLEAIAEMPGILTCRLHKIKQRHMFLDKLGRAQYNPQEPNYVPVIAVASGSDSFFCTEIAKSSTQAYNAFLKSM